MENINDPQLPEDTGSPQLSGRQGDLSSSDRSHIDRVAHSEDIQEESGSEYSFRPSIREKDIEWEADFKITHECTCLGEDCNGAHCSCYLTPREICIAGECCALCVDRKNEFLRTERGWKLQEEKTTRTSKEAERIMAHLKEKGSKNMHYLKSIRPHDPYLKKLTFCTCKKSQCQKKYCLCFEKNVRCGEFCFCVDCQNREEEEEEGDQEQELMWERYAMARPKRSWGSDGVDHQIDQYLQEQVFEKGTFSETMEFEPPNFEQVFKSLKQ